MDDWKARLDAERVNAENVRDACLAEVQSAYNKTKRDLNKVLSETVRHANTFFDGEVAKLKERTATSKATQKVALDATAVPAFEAEAVLNVAKAAMDEAKAAAKAASDMKAFTITEAQSSMDEAVRSSRQAEAETVKSIKAAAEVLRQSARKDSRLRSRAKRLECDQEQQSLLEERILVDEIRVHISTLTATKDDTVEKRAVDKAAKR